MKNQTDGSLIFYVWQAQYPWDVRVDKVVRALIACGYRVFIIARRGPGQREEEELDGVKIIRIGSGENYWSSLPVPGNPVWKKGLKKLFKRYQPQLLITREVMLTGAAIAVASKKQVPVLIDMAEHYPAAMRSWKKYRSPFFVKWLVHDLKLPDLVEKWAVQKCQGVITVCEEMNRRLNREFGKPFDKMVAVYNTPEMERFPRELLLLQRRENDGLKVFGYHGVVIGDRDLSTVIRGFSLAIKVHSKIRLEIAGDGECLAEMKLLVSSLGLEDRVRFLGRYQQGNLPKLYSQIDFGIAPWDVNEFTNVTVANKFFDYAAIGKPVLYAKTEPMKLLMEEFQSGKGYDGGSPESVCNAIGQLLDADYGLLAKSGQKAIERRYQWSFDVQILNQFVKNSLKVLR